MNLNHSNGVNNPNDSVLGLYCARMRMFWDLGRNTRSVNSKLTSRSPVLPYYWN